MTSETSETTETTETMAAHPYDDLTAAAMRAGGSWKWSTPGEWRGEPLIGAFVAEMDYPVAPAVARAVQGAAEASHFGYLPPAWEHDMAVACQDFWADRFGWSVDPARVRPVPDVLTGLTATVRHFSRPGSAIVLPTPAYMPFLTVPAMLGRELVSVPMLADDGRFALDLDGIGRALADGGQGRGGGLVVLTNPHNPTGRVFTVAELTALAEVVERHGARVFADEVHAPITFDGHRHVPYASLSPATAAHTVTSTSASKAWNTPGLKCGQVILSSGADAAHWADTGYLAEHGTATPGVLATTAAYRDGRGWLDDTLAYLDGNRALLADADLPGLEVTVPEGTYLAWLDARGLGLPEAPSAWFQREAGVVMTDGAACGEAGTGGMRLNLAMGRPVLAEALARIRRACERRPSSRPAVPPTSARRRMGPVSTDTEVTDDATVAALLPTVARVAVVGVSDRFTRPSFRLATYLLDRTDWDVALVNPHVVETLGRLCTPTLAYLETTPDLVVVFRHPRAWLAVVDEAAAVGATAVWFPTGTDRSDNLPVPGAPVAVPAPDDVVARGRAQGLGVVIGRDLRADHRRWCAPG